MPGLTGIIGENNPELYKAQLLNMITCMNHDENYSSGSYINKELGVYVGWTALQGSMAACTPVFNEKKDVLLFFTGEEFSKKEIIINLKIHGHEFDSSDASYMVHLYEEQGIDFIKKLNGWFSGLLIDLRNKESFIINDRFGMQRIYFHEKRGQFYFSSEAKSLLRVLPELRQFDPISLGHYFACGSVFENRTLFSGISLLPGGSIWKFCPGNNLGKKTYFLSSEWEDQDILEERVFFNRLDETLGKIIPLYFDSSNIVGMSLTGGLDTRIIMSYMEEKKKEILCYTFGGMHRECFDVQIARQIAKACKQDFKVLPISESYLSNFAEYAEKTVYITDGVLDVSGSHEVYLNKLAREISPVRMTGLFGSEILRSVDYIKIHKMPEGMFAPELEKSIENAIKKFDMAKCGNPYSYVVFKLIPCHLMGRLFAAQSQVTVRTPFMDNNLVALMYQAPENFRKGKKASLSIIGNKSKILSNIPTDRGLLPNNKITYTTMYRAYYEILFKLEYYFGNGMPHWLSLLEKYLYLIYLENLIVGRHKIDQYRTWFKCDVSNYIINTLLNDSSRSRYYLKHDTVDIIVNNHISGNRNYFMELNKVLTLELISRTLMKH